jgi:predicted kinase
VQSKNCAHRSVAVIPAFPPCPRAPDWKIDWATLDELPWIREMKGCPQNPIRHAEGDVWTHVHMVCEAMAALPTWRGLPELDRYILFTSALLHDVSKAACTRLEPDGTISSRGHSWRGAVRGRHILWKQAVPFDLREQIVGLVRHHLVPFFAHQSENADRLAVEVSLSARCDWLSILAECDARGRHCPDPANLLHQIGEFRTLSERLGCLNQPYAFKNDDERFRYFHGQNESVTVTSPDFSTTDQPTVVMLSGLPGAGKDFWIQQNVAKWRMICVEAIRFHGQNLNDSHAAILAKARELARKELEAGNSFVFNGTNLTRHSRKDCIRLFAQYGARVRVVYVETSPGKLQQQNRMRKRRVPEQVIERLLDRWEVPDSTEGHQVDWIIH